MRAPFTLTVLICLAIFGEAKAAQDRQQYRRAMSDNSTSPYFVLVTIGNDMTGESVTGCVCANFLKGALFAELGGHLGQTDNVDREKERTLWQKADEIALNSTDHEFHFSNQAALSNIRLQYTEDDLAAARKAVKSQGLKAMIPPFDPARRQALGKLQRSAALACAIIEEGGSARQADITGEIYAEP